MIKSFDKTFTGDATLTVILGWMLPTVSIGNSSFPNSRQSKKLNRGLDNGRGGKAVAVEYCWKEQQCFRYRVGVTPALGYAGVKFQP